MWEQLSVYISKLKTIFDDLDQRFLKLNGDEGTVVQQQNTSSPLSFDSPSLINEKVIIVEDQGEFDTAKSKVELSTAEMVIYNRFTQEIHLYKNSSWTTYAREYLSEYVKGGLFYYNEDTGRLYWAEINGNVVLTTLGGS